MLKKALKNLKPAVITAFITVLMCSCSTAGAAGTSQSGQTAEAAVDAKAGGDGGMAQETEGEDIQYVLYLGTNDKDTNEPVCSREVAKEKAKKILIDHLGGYTIQEAEGGWKGDDGKVYQEYTLVIYISDSTLEDVHKVADELVREFNQSSVLIQGNRTTTEFYS